MKTENDLVVASARISRSALRSLDKVAMLRGQNRSQLVRLFAENIEAFLDFLEKTQGSGESLDGNVSNWIVEQLPPNITMGTLIWFRDVMNRALDIKTKEISVEEENSK